MNVLFITWDGPGPNYLESLFMPIFADCQREGDKFHLLQFTWDTDERTDAVRNAASAYGMEYSSRPVWRKPQAPATGAMMLRGAFIVVRYARRHKVSVLMPRSIIPAGMAMMAKVFLPGAKFLYDADGLMADERADFGGWSRDGMQYRILRQIEVAAIRRADAVITRTHRAKQLHTERAGLQKSDTILVVANGKDSRTFRPATEDERKSVRRELGVGDDKPLVAYAGSLGPQYHPDRMVSFAVCLKRICAAHFLFLTGSPEKARDAARKQGLQDSDHTILSVPPQDVPRYLAAADLGLAFRTPSLSQQAVAPIKVGEYLLCGVPVLSTRGIGDLDDQLEQTTAWLLDGLDDASLAAAAQWFRDEVLPCRERYRSECRHLGLKYFSMDRCVSQYRQVFQRLTDVV